MRRWKQALCAIMLVTALTAQEAWAATGQIQYLWAGKLLDRPGAPPREKATVTIVEGRISEVRDGFIDPPTGATVIDLRDKYVMPGFIDVHVHLAPGVQESRYPQAAAYIALANAQKTLMAGFTTVRNLGDSSGTTLALRDAIARGTVSGPRIVDAAAAIAPTYGHGDPRVGLAVGIAANMQPEGICDGPEDCRKVVRRQIGLGADVIKIIATGLATRSIDASHGAQLTREEMIAAVQVAHQTGLKVAAHAHGGLGLRWALDAGADSIEHGHLMFQNEGDIAALKKSGAWYVPTLSTVLSHVERLKRGDLSAADRHASELRVSVSGKSLELAASVGIPVALGTDAGVSVHGRNATEFQLLAQHGLTPAQSIMAGTVNAASLLGLADKIGSIEPGKLADIVAVDGDPMRDLTLLQAVAFVMREGIVYKRP